MRDAHGDSVGSFYGLEPRWLTWDRLYLVYVSDQMVAGARIAGQIYDERSASVGRVDIELMEGAPRKLILVGDQDPEAIVSLLRTFDPSLEVTGKPNPLPKPKPTSSASKRRRLCDGADYERLGYLSGGCLDEVTRLTGKREPEISQTCASCPNLPFEKLEGKVTYPRRRRRDSFGSGATNR